MSAREELFRLIAGRTATTAVEAIIAAGYVKVPKPPTPVYKTREEMAAFATDWDAKVEAGRAPVGTEVKTRSGVYPSIPMVKQADGSWKPKYSYTEEVQP